MRISLLQPSIVPGDCEHNIQSIRRLLSRAGGELLILPEYAVTGPLVLQPGAALDEWVRHGERGAGLLDPGAGRSLLLNIITFDGASFRNTCRLWPRTEEQHKLYPDETEVAHGIVPATVQTVFDISGTRFKVLICSDLRIESTMSFEGLQFIVFVYHFALNSRARVLDEVRALSCRTGLPVLCSSMTSEFHAGGSCLIHGEIMAALGPEQGILEVTL